MSAHGTPGTVALFVLFEASTLAATNRHIYDAMSGSKTMEYVHDLSGADFLTFGDVCEAISDRELPATVEDGYYVVRRRDLKRFLEVTQDDCAPLYLRPLTLETIQAAS
jgi:hypothetical protein